MTQIHLNDENHKPPSVSVSLDIVLLGQYLQFPKEVYTTVSGKVAYSILPTVFAFKVLRYINFKTPFLAKELINILHLFTASSGKKLNIRSHNSFFPKTCDWLL